jgi:hypothetical protein
MKKSKFDSAGVQVARLLRALAALVEKSDPDEVAAFLRSRLTTLSSGAERHVQKGTFARATAAPPDLPKLAQELRALTSRDEGHALLSSASLTRRELEKLGRLMETPILKTDNMERLTERIIEASIGSRLSSAAIRGNHTKPIP